MLFNGVRVGELTALRLDPASPCDVAVDIAIERRAPVRADTRVGIEFQGLAGALVVSLAGGSPSLPLVGSTPGEPYLLTAEKNAGVGMTQAARDVLRRIEEVVSDNAEPLRRMIASIDKFSGALARNSDSVDTIFASLERLTGSGPKVVPRIFDLPAAREFPGLSKRPDGQLQIAEPTTLGSHDSDKILVSSGAGEKPSLENAQWPDLLPKVIQSRIVQSFENAGYLRVIGRVPDGARAEAQLLIDIRSFQIATGPSATAEVELAATIVGSEGRIVEARVFRATVPVVTLAAPIAAQAIAEAFRKVATEIVLWTIAAI